jgi:hypothetical protein
MMLPAFPSTIRSLLACGAFAFAACGGTAAGGIDPESNTDGFNPVADLYDIAETQREGKVAMQQELVRRLVWSTYYAPVGGPPIRQPIGYESKQVGPDRWIYRPLYGEEIVPPIAVPPEALPAPGSVPPARLPAPRDARPGDFVPPGAAPARRGPREF